MDSLLKLEYSVTKLFSVDFKQYREGVHNFFSAESQCLPTF